MPRGKNYVNNNKGMTVQASAKKKAPSMEQCFYGKGCTRANCIYRHDGEATAGGAGGDKSTEPCMPFLAGLCTFTAAGCRKRHPNKAEAERLIAKYQQTKCRYGKHCKTAGCLYIHPGDAENGGAAATAAFPPLAGGAAAPRPATAPTGAWKPMAPTGAALVAGVATIPRGPAPAAAAPQHQAPTALPPSKPAWGQAAPPAQPAPAAPAPSQPIKTPAPAVSAWGKPGLNPILASHAATASSKATAVKQEGAINGAAAANTDNKTSNGMAKLGTVASKSKTRTAPKAAARAAAHSTAPAAAAPAPPPAPVVVTPKLATPALSFAAAAAVAPPAQQQQQQPPAPKPSSSSSLTAPQESSSLNIHAKEFVPGGGF